HHADARAQLYDVAALVVDVVAVELDGARDARAFDGVVHAVEAAQERGLAATRGADHRQHLVVGDVDAHVLDGVLAAVIDLHVTRGDERVVDGDLARGLAVLRHRQRSLANAHDLFAGRVTRARLQVDACLAGRGGRGHDRLTRLGVGACG